MIPPAPAWDFIFYRLSIIYIYKLYIKYLINYPELCPHGWERGH